MLTTFGGLLTYFYFLASFDFGLNFKGSFLENFSFSGFLSRLFLKFFLVVLFRFGLYLGSFHIHTVLIL